ncbi:HsdM family class I SAM-dependent methyltransferase [Streptococcus suis]|uniref:HsdM family class I SAM-dependent methyltransferase n=1 Tax=Streptococcus suis TaxID=1307 RepID=UPI000CF5C92C|nr:N-6 DNA methylase [Streptococcus suis]
MAEKTVDSKVISKLESVGYTTKEYNYGYSLPSSGDRKLKPKEGALYLSKSLKTTRSEFEFLIFSGQDRKKIDKLILIEDKDDVKKLGQLENVGDNDTLREYAVTDVSFYANEILSKTEGVNSIFSLAVAGKSLRTSAIYFFKNTEIISKYSKHEIHSLSDEISFIYLEKWNDWNQLAKDKIDDYINSYLLNLDSPDNELNINHIRSVAGKLSNTIDKKLKLDPFKRLLLVSGLLLGINYDSKVINSFDEPFGPSDLYKRIDASLPLNKFSSEKKSQLLKQYSFIKDDKKISTELFKKNGNSEGYPLEIIAKELLKKSPVGYSVIDLMKKSSHIDLLGNLFDIFTKYMNVGGASGDIVLTPPHLTKFMSEIVDVNAEDYILDITVGTAGFLISAMALIDEQIDKNNSLTKEEKEGQKELVRTEHLWGVDYDSNMYAVAVTNMLLHGDGKSHIFHGNSDYQIDLTTGKPFNEIFVLERINPLDKSQVVKEKVEFTKLLFNPPYDNQPLFVRNGLRNLKAGGLASIIIPKSTFNKGGVYVEEIFAENTLNTVIDLPLGQFKTKSGNKGTDVAIFIFTSQRPHNFDKDYVNFIKVKKDGVKTKGNSKGIASQETDTIFTSLREFIKSGCRDLTLIANREHFDKFLLKKLIRGKYMYMDYFDRGDITPIKEDFYDVFRNYFAYMSESEKRK